jgi:hypothetical protein
LKEKKSFREIEKLFRQMRVEMRLFRGKREYLGKRI